jgi:hypothetical protein
MALTGRAVGPGLVAPEGVVDRMVGLGAPLGIDTLALLAERAAAAGLARRGDVSCGGATRLLPARDGWLAVCLARDDDVALVPAWLEVDPIDVDPWDVVTAVVRDRSAAEIADRAAWLGLPVSRVSSVTAEGDPVRATRVRERSRRRGGPLLVVDLSSLWAGPLCARLLGDRGARVVKVESTDRPDGARRGPAAFYERLHGGHESVVLDLRAPAGVRELERLLRSADVVIEASRPRALEQLGIDATAVVDGGPDVWVSITGYGRHGGGRDRVAFGDDAAAAGGLLARDEGGLCFVADAVADPLTGVAAAAAATAALAAGGGWLLDVAMSRVAAHVAAGAPDAIWDAGEPGEAVAPAALLAGR